MGACPFKPRIEKMWVKIRALPGDGYFHIDFLIKEFRA
jgi:hypothetical protein